MNLTAQILQSIGTQKESLESDKNPIMETRIKAHIEYLESLNKEISNGLSEADLKTKLQQEVVRLDEEIAHEEACSTFDWYDDHYYEKIYLGQRDACQELLAYLQQ